MSTQTSYWWIMATITIIATMMIHTYTYVCIYIYIYIYICVAIWLRATQSSCLRGSWLKIHQRGMQWKQGVVIYVMLYSSWLCNATPIHCTPLRLQPRLNTHWRGKSQKEVGRRLLRFPPTDWAEDNRPRHFWSVLGCSVYVGNGPRLSLVDLRLEGLY